MTKDKIPKIDDTTLPLYDEELEKDVVGQLMRCSGEQIRQVRESVSADMFYHTPMQNIFRVVCKLNDDGCEVTPTMVVNELMKRHLMDMPTFVPFISCGYLSYVELIQHLPILVDYSKRRKLFVIGHALINEGTGINADVAKVIENTKNGLDEIVNGKSTGLEKTGQDILKELTKTVDDNMNGVGALTTKTGFEYIDSKGGFQETDLIIVAGSTSMGKTSFVNSIAMNMITNGDRVGFYSMEMTSKQLMARLLSNGTRIYPNRIMTAALSGEEQSRFDKGVGDMWEAAANIYFDDNSSNTVDAILLSIRRLHHNYGIRGVFVDYLQLIGGQGFKQSKQEFIAECARRFKNIAKELKIWVVLLSQMNRDKAGDRENPIPTLDRLRDSGQIADAADDIMFVYRPEYYNEKYGSNFKYPVPYVNVDTKGTAMILVEKGRNRGTGTFICGFQAEATRFYNLEHLPMSNGNSAGELLNTTTTTTTTEKTEEQKAIQEVLPF